MADYGSNLAPIDIDLEYLYKRKNKLQKEIWRIEAIIKRLELKNNK